MYEVSLGIYEAKPESGYILVKTPIVKVYYTQSRVIQQGLNKGSIYKWGA